MLANVVGGVANRVAKPMHNPGWPCMSLELNPFASSTDAHRWTLMEASPRLCKQGVVGSSPIVSTGRLHRSSPPVASTGVVPTSDETAGRSCPDCGYTRRMPVATNGESVEVGVRELKNNLSRYLERVRAGDQLVVTDHGRPVARLTPIDAGTDRLAELVAAGVVQAPKGTTRHRPVRRVRTKTTVSDLVREQRR